MSSQQMFNVLLPFFERTPRKEKSTESFFELEEANGLDDIPPIMSFSGNLIRQASEELIRETPFCNAKRPLFTIKPIVRLVLRKKDEDD